MSDDLHDLRFDDVEEQIDFETEEDSFFDDRSGVQSESKFLGMSAVERMFLSIFLFMNVCVLGLALLLATRRIVF